MTISKRQCNKKRLMANYHSIKKELLAINQDTLALFKKAAPISEKAKNAFADWELTCSNIHQQLSEEVVRIAVVGAIKSGKSTFINSVLKKDYLKRGAGVVTSIVTRVRRGNNLNAKLIFKSWDEVNQEIEQALAFFPSLHWRTEGDGFDIRRKDERIKLKQALDSLGTEQLITRKSRVPGSVILASYLKGYDVVKDTVSTHSVADKYDQFQFTKHWRFVSNEFLAIYLKDIELGIDSDDIDPNLEIADCQGSDSSNPLHLAMIQDYLLLSHFIIYVISSRTGLREADIKFLFMIKKMGIIENIIFVVNCDFTEHESFDDLKILLDKIKAELALIKADPDVYSMSALFNLFRAQQDRLSEKDLNRLIQWQTDAELVGFSDSETRRFEASFDQRLSTRRYALLLQNHLARLDVIAEGMDHWIAVHNNIINQDAVNSGDIVSKVKQHQDRINHIRSMVTHTLDGGVRQIKNELKGDIDRFFDARTETIVKDIIGFIKDYKIPPEKYEENLATAGFSNTLYAVFQEFKQALDVFMAEVVNPEIFRFVREREARIQEHLVSISGPFDALMQEAVNEYERMTDAFGIERQDDNRKPLEPPAIGPLKDIAGLTAPPQAVAAMRYTARIKTETAVRLGFYTIVKVFKRLLRKPVMSQNEEQLLALKDGIMRMKRETEKSIIFHFKDYRENIKYQYIFKLVDALSNSHYQTLLDRFRAYVADLSDVVDLIDDKMMDKAKALGILNEMASASEQIKRRIGDVRKGIESII